MKNTMKYMSELTTVIALIILMAVITIINSNFLTANNLLNLLLQVTSNALIAFGMTFVILTGGIDLSVGSILALSSALTAGLLGSGMPVTLAILISLILGCILGMMNGLLISYGKLVYTNGNPITKGLSDTFLFQFLGQGYIVGIPFPVIIMFIVFIVLYVLLHKTAFGKSVYAIGGNEKAAYISGVKLNKVKIIIYSISGIMASISGLIITSRLSSAQPTAGASYEMDAIAAVVLGGTSLSGGKGRILGTLIGALIIGVLNNGLNIIGVSAFWQQVVKGVVILIAVLIDRFKVVKQ